MYPPAHKGYSHIYPPVHPRILPHISSCSSRDIYTACLGISTHIHLLIQGYSQTCTPSHLRIITHLSRDITTHVHLLTQGYLHIYPPDHLWISTHLSTGIFSDAHIQYISLLLSISTSSSRDIHIKVYIGFG
jgi:hypothetical protein